MELCSGEKHPGGDSLLHELPQSVQEDVCMKGYGDLLVHVPFFANTELSFLKQLSVDLSLYLFAPGDIVIYSGDMGRDMYLIRKGYAEVIMLQGLLEASRGGWSERGEGGRREGGEGEGGGGGKEEGPYTAVRSR